MVGDDLSTPHFQVSMSADKLTATVRVRPEGATEVDLTAADLERAVSVLGEARATMAVAMPSEPPQHPGHRELVVTDPAWRTMPPLHASLDGIFLRLRHLCYGWLTFLLPWHEAQALGKWLSDNSKASAPTDKG